METDHSSFKVGVNVFVIRDGKLLLGKRKNCFGDGSWGLPGGHLEHGESIHAAGKRELLEETGLVATELSFINVTNDVRDDSHRLHIGMMADKFSGEVELVEPDKCYEWKWFDTDSLPDPIFVGHINSITGFVSNGGPLVDK